MADKKLDIIINILKRITGLKETQDGVKDLGEEADKTAQKGKSAWKQFGEDLDKVKAGVGKVKAGLDTMLGVVKKVALGIAGAAASIGALAISSANFNLTVARAATMTDKLGFKELRSEAIKLSQELGIVKTEISGGLYQALSAGIPSDNVFSFVSTAAKIAVTDGSDVATVVDGLSTVLNAFKIDASQTDAVADAMFTTVANGKTTFAELASSMSTAAPTASALGVSYEEVLAAAVTMTKQGEPTASAMNKIRNMMLKLNDELGEGWAKTKTFQQALVEVAEKSNNSALALQQIFGMENVSGVMALTGANAKDAASALQTVIDRLSGVADAHEKVNKYMHWNQAWETITGILQQVGDVLDQTIAPQVRDIAKEIGKWVTDTAFWDKLANKMVMIREEVLSIVAAAKSDQFGIADVGNLLITYAKIAAGEAVNLLATGVVAVGRLLGSAAIDYLTEHAASVMTTIASPMSATVGFVKNQISSRLGGGEEEPSPIINVVDTSALQKQAEEQRAAMVAVGESIRAGTQEITAAAAETATTVQAAGNAVAQAMQTGDQVADAMDQYAFVVYDGNGNITEALDQAGNDVTAAAQANKEAIDSAAKQATTDLQAGASTITTAATAATGQIGGSITNLGTAVGQMATTTQQGLDQISRNMSGAYAAMNSALMSIMAQLEQTRAVANSAASKSDTALSQIKNMR